MMLQPYDIQESDISCDTTSVLTTPFSVKDILNMNLNNDNDYCNNSVKKEPYEIAPQFWENSVFTSTEYYYYNNGSENRPYWNSDNSFGDTYSQQCLQNIQQNESAIRETCKDDGYTSTDSPSKKNYVNHVHFNFHFNSPKIH